MRGTSTLTLQSNRTRSGPFSHQSVTTYIQPYSGSIIPPSQGSLSNSFAVALSSGFHASILLMNLMKLCFSSPSIQVMLLSKLKLSGIRLGTCNSPVYKSVAYSLIRANLLYRRTCKILRSVHHGKEGPVVEVQSPL